MASSKNMAEYMRDRRARRRDTLRAMLGGKCLHCETTESLEFDHASPASKSFEIASGLDRPWSLLLEEAKKCQLLCRSCHLAKTIKARDFGSHPNRVEGHGHEAVYMRGCRCDPCREARRSARVRRGEFSGTRGHRSRVKAF